MKVDKKILSERNNRKFNKNLFKNFDSYINQLMSFYKISYDLIIRLSDFFLKEKSTCYNLICSTGKLLKVIKKILSKKINFCGLDQSKEMTKIAKKGNII